MQDQQQLPLIFPTATQLVILIPALVVMQMLHDRTFLYFGDIPLRLSFEQVIFSQICLVSIYLYQKTLCRYLSQLFL